MKITGRMLAGVKNLSVVGRPLRPSESLLSLSSGRQLATLSSGQAYSNLNGPWGVFGSFFEPRQIQIQDSSHSQRLSAKEEIVEIQTHNVKPDCIEKYSLAHQRLCQFFEENRNTGLKLGCHSVGNFNVFVGEQDQFIHIWKFEDGYKTLDNGNESLSKNADYKALRKDILSSLSNRSNQYAMTFSYWPEVSPRPKLKSGNGHVYEMRSYFLKPGTMVEWGNYWARAIRLRDYKNSEPYIGTFSQVGDLYNVNHIWCYDSLLDRQKARDIVWHKENQKWSEIVSNTMPLIRSMSSRMIYPTEYSPTQ